MNELNPQPTPDIYKVMREWFDYTAQNAAKIKPIHSALVFFFIDLANSLRWPDEFGLPTYHTMNAIGVRTYRSYISAINDLCDWGYISMVEKSKNQYTSNIIAVDFLTKAKQRHSPKHNIGTVKSKAEAQSKAQHRHSSHNNTVEYNNTLIHRNTESGARANGLYDLPFRETDYVDFDIWKLAMKENPAYEDFKRLDFKHYHAVISEWAMNSGAKKINWIAFSWAWVRKDHQKGQAVYLKPRIAL